MITAMSVGDKSGGGLSTFEGSMKDIKLEKIKESRSQEMSA